MKADNLLTIEDLCVEYIQHRQSTSALQHVSLELKAGETLALVGESGCGKSTLALSVMGLLPKNGSRTPTGKIIFDGDNLLTQSEEAWRKTRGKKIAMVFQDPFSSLNPVLTMGYQVMEALALDENNPDPAKARALLERVHLPDPERILKSYPHQISGGQRQRVMIAIAIARGPKLLIADEPTTALDVTVQDEIIKLLKELHGSAGMAMIFVTHNLGLVKGLAQHVAVMRKGEVVERGAVSKVLVSPESDYTRELLDSTLTLKKSA